MPSSSDSVLCKVAVGFKAFKALLKDLDPYRPLIL